jgi:putative transposase
MARPRGSAELIEARRRQALRLLDEGYSLGEVGRLTDCAASSVMRWRDARARGGDQALKVRPAPGRPPALGPAQRQRIIKKLMKGAMANGFGTELWTTGRVATVIHRCCRIQYHRSHVARLLHDFGFSC